MAADHPDSPDSPASPDLSSESSEKQKRLVELELHGRRFRVRSDDDDAYIRDLTRFVNQKLVEVGQTSNLVEAEQVALLALLDVADALFREREKHAELRQRVKEGSTRLLSSIDHLGQALGASGLPVPALVRESVGSSQDESSS